MNKLAKWTALLGFIMCFTSLAWGKGPQGIKGTLHDLSWGSGPNAKYYSENLDEICAFCHTPHGGLLTGPLWNHSMPDAGSFTHYNSVTLSTHLKNQSVNRAVNDESLLCMSCHDGSVAIDHLINEPATMDGNPVNLVGSTEVFMNAASSDIPWARIGTKPGTTSGTGMLDDDHPISFSYTAVYADPMYGLNGSKEDELNLYTDAELAGVRFFGAENNVECSSCHDPHVSVKVSPATNQDYRPFLNTPNTGSALCLACHNK